MEMNETRMEMSVWRVTHLSHEGVVFGIECRGLIERGDRKSREMGCVVGRIGFN